jgi:hypothetical protein
LEPGFHDLHFSGALTESVRFFVGETLPSFEEDKFKNPQFLKLARLGLFVVFIVNFVILVPVKAPVQFGIFGRIGLLPMWLRSVLFGSCIAPLFLPISFFYVETSLGFSCWYGYYIGGTFFYDIWGQVIVLVYEFAVVLFGALFAAAMAVSMPWHPVFLVDVFVAAFGVLGGCYMLSLAIIESAGLLFTISSPLFVLVPSGLYSAIVFWRITASPNYYLLDEQLKRKARRRNSIRAFEGNVSALEWPLPDPEVTINAL